MYHHGLPSGKRKQSGRLGVRGGGKGNACKGANRARDLPARVFDVVLLLGLRTRGRALGRRHLRALAAGDGPPAAFILGQLTHFRAFTLVFARLALAVAEIRCASLGLGRPLIGRRSGQEYCGPEDGDNRRENFSHADHSAVILAGETDAGYGSIGTLGRYLRNGTGVCSPAQKDAASATHSLASRAAARLRGRRES